MMTSRVGMYLNWKRSRRNMASIAHMHTQLPQLYVSSCSGVGTRQRYSRCGGPSVQRSALVTKFISRHKVVPPGIPFHDSFLDNVNIILFFQCWPFSRTVHGRLTPPTVPKVLFAYISISNYFWFLCLHQVTIITKYNYILLFCRTSQLYYYYYTICSNTTIITQNAQILLLLHNMLKYYYYHRTARQIH